MTIRTLQFTTPIARPVAVVYEHLAHPQNLIGLQPLLLEMSPIRDTRENGVPVRSYETVEAFRVGRHVVYRNRSRVKMTLTRLPEQIDSLVHSPGGVTLTVRYLFAPENDGTRLTEIMEVRTPRLLASFVVSQATQAQNIVMERLKMRLEAEP
jgi:hypothetical protein